MGTQKGSFSGPAAGVKEGILELRTCMVSLRSKQELAWGAMDKNFQKIKIDMQRGEGR